jgi:hypothetical protein
MTSKTTPLEGIHYHLQGLGRANPQSLVDVAHYDGWAQLARTELERRRSQVLLGLTDAELAEIVSGRIHLNDEAGAVLETLKVAAG